MPWILAHQLCPLRALTGSKPPSCCPGSPPLPLLHYPTWHALDPCTPALPLRALTGSKPPSWCPGSPPLPLLHYPIPYALNPCTPPLSQTPWFSAYHTLTPSPLYLPKQAQPAFFRAMLVILFLSPIGSLGRAEEPMAVLSVHRPSQSQQICSPPFPSFSIYNLKCRQGYLLHAGLLRGLFFHSAAGGEMFLRKVG
jgi:hypothetical protein